MSKTFITLMSGGLDSSIATLMANQQNQSGEALFLDYGQKAIKREYHAAKKIAHFFKIPLRIIRLPFLSEVTQTALVMNDQVIPQVKMDKLDDRSEAQKSAMKVWVPNRNGLFLNIAASIAEGLGYSKIVVGFNAEEAITFPDNSANFIHRAESFFQLSTLKGLTISAPTLGMNKKEIVQEAIRLDFPLELIWSCYQGGKKMCSRCESCQRCIRAYQAAKVWDRLQSNFQ